MKMRRRSVPLLASALVLAGCGAFTGADGTDADVVAAFYPLAWVAEEVAGEELEVVDLAPAGSDPHDLELSVSQTAAVESASLVIHSSGLQPAVDDAVDSVAQGAVVDAAEVVELIEADGRTDRPQREEDEQGGEEAHEDAHDVESADLDPHFWLDPVRMARLGEEVAARLADLHPESADTFRDNAADLAARMGELDTEYTEGLDQCARDTVVVSHDAFGYLATYGLDFEPVAGLSPGSEPTPADLQRLERVTREAGVTTVFTEPLTSPRLTRSLAQDLGVETATLDPIEGLTEDTADEDYPSLMRENLAALKEANGCR